MEETDGRMCSTVGRRRTEMPMCCFKSVMERWKEIFEELMNEENVGNHRIEEVDFVEQQVNKDQKTSEEEDTEEDEERTTCIYGGMEMFRRGSRRVSD